jgi:hypothetical protein
MPMLHHGITHPSSAPWHGPKKAGYHVPVGDPRLDELWSDLLVRWTDEDAHRTFIEHCRATRHLDEAARRYVEASKRPESYREDGRPDEVAQKKLRMIAALAMVELETAPGGSAARARVYRTRVLMIRWFALALLILGLIVGFVLKR